MCYYTGLVKCVDIKVSSQVVLVCVTIQA